VDSRWRNTTTNDPRPSDVSADVARALDGLQDGPPRGKICLNPELPAIRYRRGRGLRLAWMLTGSKGSVIAATLIFGFMPESFPYSVEYMPESMFLMFLVWCLAGFLNTEKPASCAASFALWGLSVLTKPIALYLGPVLALIAVFFSGGGSGLYALPAFGMLLGSLILTPLRRG